MGEWKPNVEKDIFGRGWVTLIKSWQSERVNQAHWAVRCKSCRSEDIVRYGTDRKGRQRFLCRSCKRTFTDTNAPRGMRFPAEAIAFALNAFYESSSLHKIKRQIGLNYGVQPDHSNVYRWIVKYSRIAARELDSVPVRVGGLWVADETVLKLKSEGGQNIWFWDIIDDRTRFLLASHLSMSRFTRDAQILMERAERRAQKAPRVVITDKLAAYLGGIEEAFGADTFHIQSKGFTVQPNTNLIERFHGTIKDRTKVMRALANRRSAKLVMDGWLCHYNFFRPHSALGNKTPGRAAGAKVPFNSWQDVVRLSNVDS